MLLRLLPSLALQLIAIAWGWDLLVPMLGQGAHYLVAGWWATLLGLVMIGMALMGPFAALLLGLVPSALLRLPQPLAEGDFALAWMGAGLVHGAAYLALGGLLWRAWPFKAGPYAAFDGTFLAVAVAVAIGFGLLAAFGAGAIVARRPLRLGW
jgi:hypothetical protein